MRILASGCPEEIWGSIVCGSEPDIYLRMLSFGACVFPKYRLEAPVEQLANIAANRRNIETTRIFETPAKFIPISKTRLGNSFQDCNEA